MPDRKAVRRLARRFQLKIVSCADLTIRRRWRGRGFSYESGTGEALTDPELLARLKSLAVPPAYRDVRFASDPRAHLQAIGLDAAGRLQYRYHPDWTLVREAVKAERLAGLAEALPSIRRKVRAELRRKASDKRFALAAVVHLVAATAIRAGGERYAEEHGTRGATTLLKSHVRIDGDGVALSFRGKGGKAIRKSCRDACLSEALSRLKAMPGARLFKYRDPAGQVHAVRAGDVNAFLRQTAGRPISLKDFRTLTASLGVLDQLGRLVPEEGERARRRQIRQAIEPLADELANTLAVCQKSYVHGSVIKAFESGKLGRGGERARSPAHRMQLLSELLGSDACRPRSARAPQVGAVAGLPRY